MIYQILALFIWSSAFVAAKFVFVMLDPGSDRRENSRHGMRADDGIADRTV